MKFNKEFNNEFELLQFIFDSASYKIARKKQYVVWCCKPKEGMLIEGTEVVKNNFLIKGITGVIKSISYKRLKENYIYTSGSIIDSITIQAKAQRGVVDWFQVKTVKDNTIKWGIFIDRKYKVVIPSGCFLAKKKGTDAIIKVKCIENDMALYMDEQGKVNAKVRIEDVLNNLEMLNGKELSRAFIEGRKSQGDIKINYNLDESDTGTMLLCSTNLGKPDISKLYSFPSSIFAKTFNNRGWVEVIGEVPETEMEMPESILKIMETMKTKKKITVKEKADESIEDIEENIEEDIEEKADESNEEDIEEKVDESIEEDTEENVDESIEGVAEDTEEDIEETECDFVEESDEIEDNEWVEETEDNELIEGSEETIDKRETDGIEEENESSEEINNIEDLEDSKEEIVNSNETVNEKDKPLANDKRTIQDFGKRIGGAKKEVWASRGLRVEDLAEMTDVEIVKYVTKNMVWPKPDYDVMLKEENVDKVLIYYKKQVRDGVAVKPISFTKGEIETYIKFVGIIKELIDSMTALPEQYELLETLRKKGILAENTIYITPSMEFRNYYGNKLHKKLFITAYTLGKNMKRDKFGYSEEEKILSNYAIMKINNSNTEILKTTREEDYLRVKVSPFASVYFYSNDKVKISDVDINDKYIVYEAESRKLIGANFDTYGVAKEFTLTIGKEIELKRKAIRKEKKKALTPPMLSSIERTGEDVIGSRIIDGQVYLDEFNFKGGEFGNWLNDKERQGSLDYGYVAFCDLANILGIDKNSISFKGNLSIAFGARGRGNALAHYEPDREVINLTKMRGAGSLAHEWIHGLDHYLGEQYGIHTFLSEKVYSNSNIMNEIPSFIELLNKIKYRDMTKDEIKAENMKELDRLTKDMKLVLKDEELNNDGEKKKERDRLLNEIVKEAILNKDSDKPIYVYGKNGVVSESVQNFIKFVEETTGKYNRYKESMIGCDQAQLQELYRKMGKSDIKVKIETKFYKDAIKIDNNCTKAGHGYWASIVELLARAGACYIKDKLKEQGKRNDYLCGHADMPPVVVDGESYYTSPQGEERVVINAAFDKMIEELKSKGLL